MLLLGLPRFLYMLLVDTFHITFVCFSGDCEQDSLWSVGEIGGEIPSYYQAYWWGMLHVAD